MNHDSRCRLSVDDALEQHILELAMAFSIAIDIDIRVRIWKRLVAAIGRRSREQIERLELERGLR